MSLAGTQTPPPQYFGGDLRTYRTASDLRLSEVDYGSARRWAPHTHWRAFFALLLRGRYVETVGRSQLGYAPLDLGFHPESLQHADRIAADDTRFFLIELEDPWIRRLRECGPDSASEPRICGSRAAALALALYREFRAADGFSPAVESLALELLGELLPRRASRRPPPWVASVSEWIRTEYPRRLVLKEIARELGLHPVYLARAFREHTGCSIGESVTRARLRYAARRLSERQPGAPLSEIALDAGFADQSHFTKIFKRETGMTPGAYRPRRGARPTS